MIYNLNIFKTFTICYTFNVDTMIYNLNIFKTFAILLYI